MVLADRAVFALQSEIMHLLAEILQLLMLFSAALRRNSCHLQLIAEIIILIGYFA